MENKCHFCHSKIISNAHPWTGPEGKEIFYLFGSARVRKNKPFGIKDRFIVPVFFISMQAIKEWDDDRAFGKSETINLIVA
jgi:hypothetical protein